jgi:hypothetical protein
MLSLASVKILLGIKSGGRKTVTTWSSLATAFNAKPSEKLKSWFKHKETVGHLPFI